MTNLTRHSPFAICLLLLASCTMVTETPTRSANPVTTTPAITPTAAVGITAIGTPLPPATITGPLLHQDLPPDPDPTVENPLLHIILTITDEQTGQPVTADVTVDDNPPERAVTGLDFLITANAPHTITVAAPGYRLWSYTLRTNLHHHKRLDLPVQLEPANDQT